MARGNWVNDLNSGRVAERMVATILQSAGFKVCNGPNTYIYDLAVGIPDERCHLVEIKNETAYANSVNLCVEIYAGLDEHPSGLYTTEASLQIHIFGDECWMFKTQPMRNFLHDKLHEGTYEIKKFRNGDNYVAGILVPKEDIREMPWADVLPLESLSTSKLWR